MARADNPYSRLVAWLKIILPIVALGILSTLFLVAERLDPESAIPFAERGAIDDLVEEQGISSPAFAAVTADGTAVSVKAETARPDPEETQALLGQRLEARFEISNGAIIDITSPDGTINALARTATLSGGARLESSTGVIVTTDKITTSFDGAFAETAGAVRATGPLGQLDAGAMQLKRDETGAYLLRFTDGVRLIYEP